MVHKWYKCTINKRITKRNNDKFAEKKNRYNRAYYNGLTINAISLFMANYFPMQKREKMEPRISWVVISPVISPR